jgi:hypothetical protein
MQKKVVLPVEEAGSHLIQWAADSEHTGLIDEWSC